MCSQVPGSLCVCHCYLVSAHLSLSTRGQAHTACCLASAFQVLGFPVWTTVPSSESPSSLPLPPSLHWGLNLGPCACQVSALPLNCNPFA